MLIVAVAACAVFLSGRGAHAETPGVDPVLFANPGYTCTYNRYVSTAGNDTTGDGSAANPWATLQRADSSKPAAGTCVNVGPGLYPVSSVITLSHGGTADSAQGYVVYRSATLSGAHLIATSSIYSLIQVAGSYMWLDGFELDGNLKGCNGLPCTMDYGVQAVIGQAHHQRFTDNRIYGHGGGGLGVTGGGDCVWIVHNAIHNNASTSGYAESGVSIWEPHAVSGVTSCNSADQFHFHLGWNRVFLNAQGPTLPANDHTDGNGIIFDGLNDSSYPYSSLVYNNYGFNNGGFCVGEDHSSNVTFANNTCFDDYLDTMNQGTARFELWEAGGGGNTFMGNAAFAVKGSGILVWNRSAGSFADSTPSKFSRNVMGGLNPPTGDNVTAISCSGAANSCNDPQFISPTGNVGLQPGSPAIGEAGTPPAWLPTTDLDAGACSRSLVICN
jgi:hypothetical protein